MNDLEMSVDAIEAMRANYDAGIVVLYSLSTVNEAVVLRVVTSGGSDPVEGASYIVEFRDAKTNELLEVLEGENRRLFDPSTIMSVIDELAEDYLRTAVKRWEMYVNQSGRCSPDEISHGASEAGRIEQKVIRDLPH